MSQKKDASSKFLAMLRGFLGKKQEFSGASVKLQDYCRKLPGQLAGNLFRVHHHMFIKDT